MINWQTIKSAFSFDWLLGKKERPAPDMTWQDDAAFNDALADKLGLRRVVTVDPRTANIRLLDHLISAKERQLRSAIKNGKARVHIRAELKKLQDERARLTGTS